MTHSSSSTGSIKARIRHDTSDAPIQLDLSPEAATALAYIADDFAREIVENCDEARYLIAVAETISMRLMDCLAVHSPGAAVTPGPRVAGTAA